LLIGTRYESRPVAASQIALTLPAAALNPDQWRVRSITVARPLTELGESPAIAQENRANAFGFEQTER
jgi:hypothetical protein